MKIDLQTALALFRRGHKVVPCEPGEKRPAARLGNWRKVEVTEQKVKEWFGASADGAEGGIVLTGEVVYDQDHRDTPSPYADTAPTEATAHGWHSWFRRPDGSGVRIEHDATRRVDLLCAGAFCKLYEPRVLLDWEAREGGLPVFPINRLTDLRLDGGNGSNEKTQSENRKSKIENGGSLLGMMQRDGWKTGRGNGRWTELTKGTKTASISADGSVVKMFSGTLCEPPDHPTIRPSDDETLLRSGAELAVAKPALGEAVLKICRRGSFALVCGSPKAGKTWWALRTCLNRAQDAHGGFTTLYADLENGPALFWHRVERLLAQPISDFRLTDSRLDGGNEPIESKNRKSKIENEAPLGRLWHLDLRESAYPLERICEAAERVRPDIIVVDCWGLLVATEISDENSNAETSAFFRRLRRALAPFDAAVLLLHHLPKSGTSGRLNYAGCGASALPRYVQSICWLREKDGKTMFEALRREFDEPFAPVEVEKLKS